MSVRRATATAIALLLLEACGGGETMPGVVSTQPAQPPQNNAKSANVQFTIVIPNAGAEQCEAAGVHFGIDEISGDKRWLCCADRRKLHGNLQRVGLRAGRQ